MIMTKIQIIVMTKVMVLSESKGNEEGCRCCKMLRRIQEKVLFQICKC